MKVPDRYRDFLGPPSVEASRLDELRSSYSSASRRAEEQRSPRIRNDNDDEPPQHRDWHFLDDERGDQDSRYRADSEAEHYPIVEFDEMDGPSRRRNARE